MISHHMPLIPVRTRYHEAHVVYLLVTHFALRKFRHWFQWISPLFGFKILWDWCFISLGWWTALFLFTLIPLAVMWGTRTWTWIHDCKKEIWALDCFMGWYDMNLNDLTCYVRGQYSSRKHLNAGSSLSSLALSVTPKWRKLLININPIKPFP